MKFSFKKSGTHRGIALLTAMFLGTLLVLTAIGVRETIVTGVRGGVAVELANQAYYAASSGLRHALYEARVNAAGLNASSTWESGDGTSATWEIVGRLDGAELDAWRRGGSSRFLLPYPGSGDAGDDCSFREAQLSHGEAYGDLNDPCNWQRLRLGDAVAIPLYTDDPDSDDPADLLNIADLFATLPSPQLRLKLRTDCNPAVADNEDPVTCGRARVLWDPTAEGADAEELDRSDGVDNDTIVLWEIVGECGEGGEMTVCILQPDTSRDNSAQGITAGRPPEPLSVDGSSGNTEIKEFDINLILTPPEQFAIRRSRLAGFNFLDRQGIDQNEQRGSIGEFLGIGGSRGPFAGATIERPVLKLSLVHSLQRENRSIAGNIPYLEWQLETPVPLASPESFVIATGRAGSFVQTLTSSLEKEAAEIDFVIQN